MAAARGEPAGQFVNQNVGKQKAYPGSTIHISEAATGKEILILNGHHGPVSKLAWSPDGRCLASGDQRSSLVYDLSGAQTVRLWDVGSGKELASYGDFKSDVTALMFAPDGKSLGAGLRDGSILIWDIGKLDSKQAASAKLGQEELESRWRDLAGGDALRAHQAIWTLAAAPQESVPFLQGRPAPPPVVDPAKLRQWTVDQESPTFAVRPGVRQGIGEGGRPGPKRRPKGDQGECHPGSAPPVGANLERGSIRRSLRYWRPCVRSRFWKRSAPLKPWASWRR